MNASRVLALLGVTLGASACGLILGIPEAIRDDTVGQEAGKADTGGGDSMMPTDSGGTDQDSMVQDTGTMETGTDGGLMPVKLTTGNRPWGLAIDDMFVFWSEPSNYVIGRCNKDGSNPQNLATGINNAFGVNNIAADGTSLFWAQFDKIFKCARGGCNNAPTQLNTNLLANSAYRVAVDATHVFFVERVPKTLYRVAKTGGMEELLATLTEDANFLVVDNGFVIASLVDGSVVKVPVNPDAGSPVVLAPTTGKDSWAITITNGRAYYTELEDPGNIAYTPLGGPLGSTPVALMQRLPFGITNDVTDLYWTETVTLGPTGNVKKCSLANCGNPTVLASMQNVPKYIVNDTTALYWTNYGNGNGQGELMKLAK